MKGLMRMLVVAVATLFCSCLAPQNVEMVNVDAKSWDKAESLTYDNSDTLSLRNLNITIRYNDDFKQATLPLKIEVTTPDERHFTDTVQLKLHHPSTALSVATTESLPYRTSVLLNHKGRYTFSFEPLSKVRGVEAIGVEIKN